MKYCTECGTPVEFRVPAGDTHPRHVCPRCSTIHYRNPKLVVGCIVEWEERILLCRRAIEPCYGRWTLPAGFMESGESAPDAAHRETQEEAGAHIVIDGLFSVISIPHIDQVHLFYRGRLLDGRHAPGIESLETALLSEDRIPWETLAFRSVSLSLEGYLSDRRRGRFTLHEAELPAEPTY